MSNRAGWANAGNFGIAALAVAIIAGIGLLFTGVIAPVEIPKLPDVEATQADGDTDTDTAPDTASDQSTAVATESVATQTGTPDGATDQTTAEAVAEVTPETTPTVAPEQVENAGDAMQQTKAPASDNEPATAGDETAGAIAALPAPPSIDVFRLETDGAMLVAGQTQPGWETTILLDGAAIASVTPDSTGQFAEFLNLEYSDQPRVLSLLMRAPDGQAQVASTDEIILAPSPKTVVVAAADAADAAQPKADEATVPETPTAESEANPPAGENAAQSTAQSSQAVLLANETGVKVLQPPTSGEASPEVMSTVALDAITYSDEGQVQLSGRALGSGSVRVYLDNAPVITATIEEDGNWRSELPQVDTGVYTLRVDELDDQGRVTSRVETPFKREDEAVLAQAGAAQGSSKVTAVTVQPGSTLWAISREAYGEGTLYVRVFEANKSRIRDPDLIYPGQVFTIPK